MAAANDCPRSDACPASWWCYWISYWSWWSPYYAKQTFHSRTRHASSCRDAHAFAHAKSATSPAHAFSKHAEYETWHAVANDATSWWASRTYETSYGHALTHASSA
eukprot:GCRY01001433.1.p2 GENE.GCRY01001433.1~~GCRY01001433.1.p2  ORF type:complete len:106 (-),score=4.46 GCRY01001433.1:122-439(-)